MNFDNVKMKLIFELRKIGKEHLVESISKDLIFTSYMDFLIETGVRATSRTPIKSKKGATSAIDQQINFVKSRRAQLRQKHNIDRLLKNRQGAAEDVANARTKSPRADAAPDAKAMHKGTIDRLRKQSQIAANNVRRARSDYNKEDAMLKSQINILKAQKSKVKGQ